MHLGKLDKNHKNVISDANAKHRQHCWKSEGA